MKNDFNTLIKAWDWSEIIDDSKARDRFSRKLSDVFAVSAALISTVCYYQADLSVGSFLAVGTLTTVSAGYLGKKVAVPIYKKLYFR